MFFIRFGPLGPFWIPLEVTFMTLDLTNVDFEARLAPTCDMRRRLGDDPGLQFAI